MKDFFGQDPLFAFLTVAAIASAAATIASQALDAYVKTHTPVCCDCPESTPKIEEK